MGFVCVSGDGVGVIDVGIGRERVARLSLEMAGNGARRTCVALALAGMCRVGRWGDRLRGVYGGAEECTPRPSAPSLCPSQGRGGMSRMMMMR